MSVPPILVSRSRMHDRNRYGAIVNSVPIVHKKVLIQEDKYILDFGLRILDLMYPIDFYGKIERSETSNLNSKIQIQKSEMKPIVNHGTDL